MPDLACRAGWALALPSTTPAPVPARITVPSPGAALTSTSVTFNWDAGVGVTGYQLTIGTTPGGNDLYSGSATAAQSALVSGLPSTGGTIWARPGAHNHAISPTRAHPLLAPDLNHATP